MKCIDAFRDGALARKRAAAEKLANFSVVANHVLTPAAITHSLESPEVRRFGTVPLDGFIGPAYVSTAIGRRVVDWLTGGQLPRIC